MPTNFIPPPVSGFIQSGGNWIAATATTTDNPAVTQPPPVGLFVFQGGAWVPLTGAI